MTDRKYHFISGLPRSGSTLTAALLRQNPRFHAGMASPIATLFDGMIAQVSAGTELSTSVTQAQRARLLRGLFESYYAEHEAPVIFDSNRAWTANLPALMQVFPEARVICLVRNVAWIMDSMERRFRQNPFEHTRLFNSSGERSSVYTRVEALAGATRLVGYPWHALREACYSDFADRMVLIDYDILVRRPGEVMKLIYDFIGEAPFAHDFAAAEYDAEAFDQSLGIDGMHRVHPKVEPRPRDTLLPPELFEKYAKLSFWNDLAGSRAFRITTAPDDAPPAKSEAEG